MTLPHPAKHYSVLEKASGPKRDGIELRITVTVVINIQSAGYVKSVGYAEALARSTRFDVRPCSIETAPCGRSITAMRLRGGKGKMRSSIRKIGVNKFKSQISAIPKSRRLKILPFTNQTSEPTRLKGIR